MDTKATRITRKVISRETHPNLGTARKGFESLRFYVLECRLLSCDRELFVTLLARDIRWYLRLKMRKESNKMLH